MSEYREYDESVSYEELTPKERAARDFILGKSDQQPTTDNYDPYENISHQGSNVAAHGKVKGNLVTACQVAMVVGVLLAMTGNVVAGGGMFIVASIAILVLTW